MRRLLSTALTLVAATALAAPAVAGPPERTTIDDVAGSGGFTQLDAALDYTGLDDLVDGNRQFTVFAPTDDAFQDLYVFLSDVLGTQIDEIEDLPVDTVAAVLAYHVAPGERFADDVLASERIRTLAGEFATITSSPAMIDGATIVAPDAADVDNGVVHVIDAVIVPASVLAALGL